MRKRHRRFVLSLLSVQLLAAAGCSGFHIPIFGGKTQANRPSANIEVDARALQPNKYLDRGRIFDRDRIRSSRNIVVVPFKAGVNAVATLELDRAALMIVKGAIEVLTNGNEEGSRHFAVLTAESAGQADLIIKGYITEMAEPAKVKRWLMMGGKKRLAVSGKMIDARTGDTLMVFEEAQQASASGDDYLSMGHAVGANIGRYILSAL